MSDQAVQKIIDRAVKDEAFRQQLFTDPDTALSEYDLTAAELETLKGLDPDNFDAFAGGLGNRSTKGRWVPGLG